VIRLLLAIVCASCWSLVAGEPATKPKDAKPDAGAAKPTSFDREIEPLLSKHCFRCHNADKAKGGIDLKRDANPRLMLEHRKNWLTAIQVMRQGEMPPEDAKPILVDDDRRKLLAFIEGTVATIDCAQVNDPGRPLARRLNRREYENSVRDLLGIDATSATSAFTADGIGFGFDNIGEALAMSPELAGQYFEAAQKLLAELARDPRALARVTGPPPGPGDRPAARAAISRFATRAYRKPVDGAHLDRLLTLFDRARVRTPNLPFAEALRPALLAVLISPRFLVRIEDGDPKAAAAYPVRAHDLASRLSYFLWSSPPDDELLGLAADGRLTQKPVIEAQVRRMLADPRSRALAEHFIGQWLQVSALETHRPDRQRFPEFTDSLRTAMAEEATLFAGEIIRQDRPITDLIAADYTWLNEELALHYGITGVKGPQMRRVTLNDHRRGGMVTMAAVLTVTSDPTRTNIPRRGNYLLGAILGAPPPPPPPMVPALEESKAAGATTSLRAMLELHRKNPECANCHAKMDPLGFALENFDAIGRWQERRDGLAIDASGLLPSGERFDGPAALKQVLLARRPAFARTMTERMLIYALGRGLEYYDDCAIDAVTAAVAQQGWKTSTMVTAIATSYPFTMRRNPEF